ncbi:MAG: hypothetical protein LBT51_10905 [Fusobacteriaceae bacterium]|jgi:hypothetical protein|nr:hypothetical protein [Fusobacteriaceae bacterium]
MKNIKKLVKKESFIYLVLFILLFYNFNYNLFGIVNESNFMHWDQQSESIVRNTVLIARKNGIFCNYGLMTGYLSQIGLQSILFRIIDKLTFNNNKIFSLLHAITTILFCINIFYILNWIKNEFSKFTAVIVYFTIFLSNWLIMASRNLYWVIFTFLLPFVIMLYFLSMEDKGKKIKNSQLLLGVFITIFIKCACGFEAISSVLITMMLPFIYYGYKNSWNLSFWIKRTLIIGLCGFFTTLFTLVIQIVQLSLFFSSYDKAKNYLNFTFLKRIGESYSEKIFLLDNNLYLESLESDLLTVVNMYVFQAKYYVGIFFEKITIFNILFLFLIFVIVYFIIYEKIEKNNSRKLISLLLIVLICFFAPISWFIIGKGHSYIHGMILYILWYLPFTILIFTFIGYFIYNTVLINKINLYLKFEKIKYKKYIVSTLLMIVMFIVYANYSYSNKQIKKIVNIGTKLYDGKGNDIYYFQNKLYYILNRKNVPEYRMFLHVYVEGANGFKNLDFDFYKYIVKSSLYNRNKMAVINLGDLRNIKKIDTGEYNPFDIIRNIWEASIDIKNIRPMKIVFANLFDKNIGGGILRKDHSIVVIENPIYNIEYLNNKKLKTYDGQELNIRKIEKQGNYYYLYLDNDINVSNCFPTQIEVIE